MALFYYKPKTKSTPLKLPFTSKRYLALAVCLSFLIRTAAGACASVCDGDVNSKSLRPNAVTTSGGTTLATDLTTTITTAYLDPIVTKPATGAWYITGYCQTTTFGSCATGVAPLVSAYTVSISPAACQSLLWWNTARTQPCTSSIAIADGVAPLTITAQVTNNAQTVTTNSCNLVFGWTTSPGGVATTDTFPFSLTVLACNANSLAWTTVGFSIATQTYYVYDAAKTVTASLATQTNACGYAVTYSLLVQSSPPFATADSSVFTLISGTPNTISIATSTFSKAGTYNLFYRASITNARTSTVVNLDATFTVMIIDRCATATFTPQPSTITMATTALSTTAVTAVLTYKDSVSSANGNSDGFTYCGNRVWTIDAGMSPQTFLTLTSNSLQSTLTLLSNQLSDATACASCTVKIKVCFVNYPTVCSSIASPDNRASIAVTIGACVVTSYTAAAYADFSYTIATAATSTPYPTFTQTPACGYLSTKTVTVNTVAFPGTNLNGGGSMSAIFGDDTTNKKFTVVDSTLQDGTNTYTFVFTSTLVAPSGVSGSSTFKIILVNPCLSTVIQDNGQTMTFSGSEMMAAPSANYNPFTQFKNSYAGTSILTTTGCGPYTYSLNPYTGSFMVFNSATLQLQLQSTSTTDSTGSPYTIGLKACLTNYPTVTCFTKSLTVTIADCIISTYTPSTTLTAKTYTIGATALVITLPTYTQSPLCAYTETKSCFLTASPTACPSWVTATQTTWTIYCSSPASCPAAVYSLIYQTALSNSPVTTATQTQSVTIVDPCTSLNGNLIATGTVAAMTTSALSTTAVTQTLTTQTDSASTTANIASMCGASTFTLVAGTYSASYLSLSGNTLTLLSTSLSDVGTYTGVQVKQCLSTAAYNNVCRTFTFTVTVTACSVVSWTTVPLAALVQYINDASTSSALTTWTQSPACNYAYSTVVSISGTTIGTTAFKGVTRASTTATTLAYYDTTRNDAGTYTITFTPTVTGCTGVCTITAATTSLVWKDPCQKTVLGTYTAAQLPSKVTTALGPAVSWSTMIQLTDSVSLLSAGDGVTYCGPRTYTFSGQGSWLTFTQGTGTAANTLVLQSTSLADYSATPYTITLTVSLPAYADVVVKTFTFTITISACSIASVTVTGTIANQIYVVGAVQQTVSFPSYTQVPACNYAVTYTFKRGTGSFVTSDTLMSVASQTQFAIGVATDLTLAGTHSITLQPSFASSPVYTNTATTFSTQVNNPCTTTSWVPNTITVTPISLLQTVDVKLTIKDTASSTLGNLNGITLCGMRTYTWYWTIAPASTTWVTKQTTNTETDDTIRFAPTTASHQGVYQISVTACLSYITTGCYSQLIDITVNPCQVLSSTKANIAGYNAVASVTYTPYTSGVLSYTFPLYTQSPACGYTWIYTLKRQDNTPVASPLFTQTLSIYNGYQIFSTSISDAGTYPLKLSMTLASYPTIYTAYEDATLTWTVTVTNPCTTTVLNAFTSTFATMSTSVMGTMYRQPFSIPTDTFSAANDIILDYEAVVTPYTSSTSQVRAYAAPAKGINICGSRSYTIDPTCSAFLTMWSYSTGIGDGYMYLRLYPTLSTQVTTGKACSVTAYLTNYPTITKVQSVNVVITACVLNSISRTLAPPAAITEYFLMDTAVSIPFPTYSQSPACNYPVTYTCLGTTHTDAMQLLYIADILDINYIGKVPAPTTALSTTLALANTVKCDTAALKVNVDIKQFVPTLSDLTNYQYQGDYNLVVAVNINGLTDNSYIFQLRIINPCWQSNPYFSTYLAGGNYFQARTISDMFTSVLLASQPIVQTWTAFTDEYSSSIFGPANAYTLCGTRTYTKLQSYSWLAWTTPAASPNINTFSVNSVTPFVDVGDWPVTINARLTLYTNVTYSTTFQVHISDCIITAFNAPTLAAQSYTILGLSKTISIPTYTQVPACQYSVSYTSTIQKTADANANRLSLFPDQTSQFSISSSGITLSSLPLRYLYFIKHYGSFFTVYTDELRDGGTYTVYISAIVQEAVLRAIDTNTALSFQLTIVDPCATSVVNSIAADPTLNRVATTIETSVKYGQSGVSPFSYVAQQYQFYTYMDSVSVAYNTYVTNKIASFSSYDTENLAAYLYPYDTTSNNLASIYCGKRTYVFGGAGNPMPAWLSFNADTGTISVQTTDDAMVNYSPGHLVTLKACLEFYPTVCSAAVTYTVIINECQIVTFVNDSPQPNIPVQYIFDVAVGEDVVTYTQTPLCGWTLTYTAVIKDLGTTYGGTAVTVGQSVVTGTPAWATYTKTSTPLRWSFQSKDYLDATTFTITQIVTLNDKLKGALKSTSWPVDFTVTFKDPCWDNSFVLQNGPTEPFDASSTAPLIRTSVKYGQDQAATPLGDPAKYTFDFHHDLTSDRLPVSTGTSDPSNWVCGPRTYTWAITSPITIPPASNFVSVIHSPTTSTTTKPIIQAMTALDSDIGTWQITLNVYLSRYMTVVATETFYVKIDQCILNTLTEVSGLLRNPATAPYQFLLYFNALQQLPMPLYTQAPLCNYPLSYSLTQIQTWSKETSSYDTTQITCPFASFDSLTSPSFIKFESSTWTDDPCDYGTGTTCDLTISNPYQLMLTAYIDPVLITTDIVFPTTKNEDEKFFVLPQDPCYGTTLFPELVPERNYFLGDALMRIPVLTTQDTVSQDAIQYLVDSSGYDKCGPRTYQVLTSANALPPYATVPLQQDPPVISVQTNNAGNVGQQNLVLITGLANYPQISVSQPFILTIYNFKVGKQISLQYYQITKQALTLIWAPFTLSPTPPAGTSMIIFYMQPSVVERKTGQPMMIPPSWLTVDTTLRTLKIFTNAFSDQGVYDIIVYAGVTGYTFRQNQTITVNITKTPPPQLSTTPPNFTLPLVDKEFKMGEELTFSLPATFSVGSFAIKATVTQGPKWLTFDAKSLTFTVKQGATKIANTGEFKIQITLQDTAGGKATYDFKLTCIAPPVVVPVVFPTAAAVAYPVPKITKITNKGVVTVVWDQQMRIPRNLTQVSNGSCSYVNPITYDIERQPNLDVQIIPGSGSEGKNLSFSWNFTSWDTKAMTLQLYFQTPEDVSYGTDPERLKLIFYGMPQFVSQTGIPVNGGRDVNKNSIPILKIPAQIPINVVPVVRRNNKAGMSTGQIGPMMFQLGISSLLNSVWGMVDTQQIIILLPLFDIVLPANAQDFFAQLMTIAAFAIIPTDPIFGWMFAAPPANLPLPLSDNFMNVGFATTYITNNMGTLFFSLMYFPIMVCVYYLIKGFSNKRIMTYRIGLGRNLFWSNTFQTFSDQYTIIATCSLIQLAYLDWSTNYGTKFCSFLGCFYTGVALALPFVVAVICWKNYDLIKSNDKVFKQRFNSMWSGLSTEDRGFIVYHWYFLLRRFLIGVLCVFARKSLFFQISGLVFNIIFGAIVAGNTLCMEDKRLNTIEYFNETMIMMVMYCLICFTDFLPDASTRSSIGLVCEGFVIFHIVFNLSFLIGDYILNLKLRYKRWALFRKYAKMRAIKNQKLQKKLRHQRFVQHLEKNKKIQAQKDKKRLHPISEESKEGSGDSDNLRSYEYARDANEVCNNSSLYRENSEQDLNYGDHFDITKGLSRQPAEAPEIKLHRLKEFSDKAATSDKTQNQLLGQTRPVEFARDIERLTHKNLVKNKPYDSIFPDIQSIMNECDFDDLKDQSQVDKLKRRVNETPINLQSMNPLKLVHNKLARMVQHDVSLGSSQVKPETKTQSGLKILADTEAIHKKLFQKMDAGDGPKVSGTETHKNSRNNVGRRKQIITYQDTVPEKANIEITEDSQGNLFGPDGHKLIYVPGMKATIPYKTPNRQPSKKIAQDDLSDLIEEEKEETKEKRSVKRDEMNELISEITAEEIKPPLRRSQNTPQIDQSHATHVKLFGSKVGQKSTPPYQQEKWEEPHSVQQRSSNSQISKKESEVSFGND